MTRLASMTRRARVTRLTGVTRRVLVALVAWALLLVVARVWGLAVAADLQADGVDLKLGAIPLYGSWEAQIGWRLAVPAAVAAVAVLGLPWAARRLPWRWALLAAAAVAVTWSLALAVAEPGGVSDDIHLAYGRHIPLVDDRGGPADFLRTYVENQDSSPIHLQAHPPGLVLGLWASAEIGLAGPDYETTLAMAAVAVGVVAALAVARDVAGDAFARRAAPFVALAPAAVWHTNADVVFGGVALAGVALVVLATGGARWSWVLAVAGGALFGAALLLSYGVALLAAPIGLVALWRRRFGLLATAAASGAVVVALPLVWGFWWLDGLGATREQYYAGVGALRPYWYFLVANLAVFALAVGLATAAGLARLRDRRAWLVVGGGLVAVALADLSGLSSGETERIWQPFMPLVLLAAGALGAHRSHDHRRLSTSECGQSPMIMGQGSRWWLAAQAAVALALAAALRSPW